MAVGETINTTAESAIQMVTTAKRRHSSRCLISSDLFVQARAEPGAAVLAHYPQVPSGTSERRFQARNRMKKRKAKIRFDASREYRPGEEVVLVRALADAAKNSIVRMLPVLVGSKLLQSKEVRLYLKVRARDGSSSKRNSHSRCARTALGISWRSNSLRRVAPRWRARRMDSLEG
jgi:hypothetical protein